MPAGWLESIGFISYSQPSRSSPLLFIAYVADHWPERTDSLLSFTSLFVIIRADLAWGGHWVCAAAGARQDAILSGAWLSTCRTSKCSKPFTVFAMLSTKHINQIICERLKCSSQQLRLFTKRVMLVPDYQFFSMCLCGRSWTESLFKFDFNLIWMICVQKGYISFSG